MDGIEKESSQRHSQQSCKFNVKEEEPVLLNVLDSKMMNNMVE